MEWLEPTVLIAFGTMVTGLISALGVSIKNLIEARKMNKDIKSISAQVHNNHGSSIKDSTDRILPVEKAVAESQNMLEHLVRMSSEIRRDVSILAERVQHVDVSAHETHTQLFRRIETAEAALRSLDKRKEN